MIDPRIQKLALTLVTYSVALQPGEIAVVMGDVSGLPLIREIYQEVIKAGGLCFPLITDERLSDFFIRHAKEEQLAWLPPLEEWMAEDVAVTFRVSASANTRRGTSLDPKRVSAFNTARDTLIKTRFKRSAANTLRWNVSLFPTEAFAQEASMSLEEYEDFVYSACFVDQPDPIQCWRDLEARQHKYVDWLKGHDQIKVRGPNVEMSLSIKDRTFINSTARRNMPSGEIFTGPVEDSVNGWVRFTYPAIKDGRQVDGIELKFESGKVVHATAQKNEDYLLTMLNTDPGASFLGEWAIGANYGINRFTGQILFDEKIGGTIHMAVGRGYPETGSRNQSAIHWDMICDMRTDSEIVVDGELFYKDGQFVI